MDKVFWDEIWWNIRPETLDEYVIKEARSYFKRVELDETDVWLDVGANIGAFSVRAAQKALAVIAVEPAPDNLKILYQNTSYLDNVVVVPMALIGASKMTSVALYLNAGKNPGGHSMYVQGGRSMIRVLAVGVNKIIKKYGVNKMKIDTEGAELDILYGLNDETWSMLTEVILEYHIRILKDEDRSELRRLLDLFQDHGFTMQYSGDPFKEGNKSWHCLVWGSRTAAAIL